MYYTFLTAIAWLSDILWAPPTMIFIAFVSVYVTVRTRFFQVTNFMFIMRRTFGRMFRQQYR